MATETVDPFLRAEAEASRLIEELTRLKVEMESYRTARTALGEAGTSMAQVANKLGEVAHRLDGVVEALRTIGTPELLRAQEAASAELVALRAELAETCKTLEAGVASQQQILTGFTSQVRGEMNATARSVQSIRGLLLSVGGAVLVGLVLVALLVVSPRP